VDGKSFGVGGEEKNLWKRQEFLEKI